jgi:inosose dehydratase
MGCGAAVLAGAQSGKGAANIRWGLGTVTWVVKAGAASPKWEDVLGDIQAAGFDGVEAFTTKTFPVNDANMSRLEELLPRYEPLRLSAIYWSDQWHREEEHERQLAECHRFLRYLKRFGSDRLLIGPPPPETPDEKKAISNMAKIMNAIGKIALEQYAIKTGIHPHMDSLIENPRQTDQLFDETNPRYFGFAPDTMQIWVGGGDPVKTIRKYLSRVVYLHYKDSRPFQRSRSPQDHGVELGGGHIDFPAIQRMLKEVGYRGWIVMDVAKTELTALQSARTNMAYINKTLKQIYS